MGTRKKIADDVIEEVLTRSRRRCCFCYGLKRDGEIKEGQIAHLDRDNTNNRPDNLGFLCLVHHNQYDSRTSQSKGLTEREAKAYRNELYSHLQSLVLTNVMVPATSLYSTSDEKEALIFHTGTHRSRSAVLLAARGPLTIEELNEGIPPSDLKWTQAILLDVVQAGWLRRVPGDYRRYELTMNGKRMLEVLALLPDELKENALTAVWNPKCEADLPQNVAAPHHTEG